MSLLLRWLASVGALLLVAAFVPGIVIDDVPTAFVAALVLGVVNGVIGPVVRFLALPLRLLTLGLFSLVINAALFALAAYLVPGFGVEGGGMGSVVAVFVGALAYGILAGLIQGLFGVRKK